MVIVSSPVVFGKRGCPHCHKGYLMWDFRDKESYCFNCGWRRNIFITHEQSKARVKWSSWLQLIQAKLVN